MTTTKILYVLAVVLPFGFALLAGGMLLHALYKRHRAKTALAAH